MYTPEIFYNTTWMELLNQIKELLLMDEEKLKSNKEYYRRMYTSGNMEETKIQRLFRNIEHDQERLNYVSELVYRLDNLNYKMMLLGIDWCFENDVRLKSGNCNNYQITVTKTGTEFEARCWVP